MVYQPHTASLQIAPEVAVFDATAGWDLGAAEPVTTVPLVVAGDGAGSPVDEAGAAFPPIDRYGESDPHAVTLPVAGAPALAGPLFDAAPAVRGEQAPPDSVSARPRGWLGRLVDKLVAPFVPQPQGTAPETVVAGDETTLPTDGAIDPASNAVSDPEGLLTGAEELVSGWQDQGVQLIPELDLVCDGTGPSVGDSPDHTDAPKDQSGRSSNNPPRSRPTDNEGPALSRLPVATEPATPPTPAAIPYTYYYAPGQVEVPSASEPLETPVTVATVGLEPGPAVGLAGAPTQDDGAPAVILSPLQGIATGTETDRGATAVKKSLPPQVAVVDSVAAEDTPALPGSERPPATHENLLTVAEEPVDPHAGHHHGAFAGETTDTAPKGAPVNPKDIATGTSTSTGRAAVDQTGPTSLGDRALQPAVAGMELAPHIATTDRSILPRDLSALDPTQGHQGRDGDEQRDGDGQDDQTDSAGWPFLPGASAFLKPSDTPHGVAGGLLPIQPGFVFIPAGAATGTSGARAHTAAATQRDQAEVGRGLAHTAATVAHKTDNPAGDDRDRQGEPAEQAGIIAAFNAAGPVRRRPRSSLTRPNPQSSATSSDVYVTGLG